MSFPKIVLPRMVEVRQVIPSPKLEDFVSEIRKELKKAGLSSKIETGAKIAITAGSRGIAHIAESTQEHALIAEMSMAENTFLGRCNAPGQHCGVLLKLDEVMRAASSLASRYAIRPSDPDTPVRELSGGNQQKVVVARELSWVPSIVVAAYPTRGLDLGTRLFLHNEFLRLRRKGVAVLLISADLEEVLTLSDRVLVFYAGETRGPFRLDELSEKRLGLLMTGVDPA